MVGVAQLVEPRIVIPVVAGSSPVAHPISKMLGMATVLNLHRDSMYSLQIAGLSCLVCWMTLLKVLIHPIQYLFYSVICRGYDSIARKTPFITASVILSCLMGNSYAAHSTQLPDQLETLFQQAIHNHAFPGGCVEAGNAKRVLLEHCYGHFTYTGKTPDDKTSIFDLASLTKVVATTSAIMILYDQGKIQLTDKVVKYLPSFFGLTPEQTALKSQITILQLLTHTSGLPAENNAILAPHITVKERWQAVLKTPVIAYP